MESVYSVMASPLGELTLVARSGALTAVRFADEEPLDPGISRDDAALEPVRRQLADYFTGRRRAFDFPLEASGTAFQQKVWRALRDIPYGTTRSYSQVAAAVGSPRAVRAVGAANGRNPLAIVVPCHRVVGSDGSLTGYAGGLERKRQLLELERSIFRSS